MCTVSYEFSDGSGGECEFDLDELAQEAAYNFARTNPTARVWIGDEQVQRGFIAADERGEVLAGLNGKGGSDAA